MTPIAKLLLSLCTIDPVCSQVELLLKKILLTDVARALGYKSLRSARRWCQSNGVQMLSNGGRKKFVLLTEFRMKYLEAVIEHLCRQYGRNWRVAFDAHLKDDVVGLMTVLKSSKKPNASQEQIQGEKAKGENEKRFSEKLNRLVAKASQP